MPVYLDHAASTPVRTEVANLLIAALGAAGNPNSVHGLGQQAKARLEQAREDIAKALNCDRNEVVFTSGGTESNNLAVLGLFEARNVTHSRPIVVTTAGEHHAVLEAVEHLERRNGAEVALLPTDKLGQLDLDWLENFLDQNHGRIALVTAIWANNETGVVVDLAGLVGLAKRYGVPVHTDAVAAVGHMPVDFRALGVDTLALTGHKLGAPVGVGALLVSRSARVSPRSFGGSQERGIRPGTQDSIGAAALALAVELADSELVAHRANWEKLRSRLIAGVAAAVPQAMLVGSGADSSPELRLSNIVNFVFPDCSGENLLFLLDSAGVAISNGSACTAGVIGGSHVLTALGYDRRQASGAVRVSFGAATTETDIDAFLGALPDAYARALRAGFTN